MTYNYEHRATPDHGDGPLEFPQNIASDWHLHGLQHGLLRDLLRQVSTTPADRLNIRPLMRGGGVVPCEVSRALFLILLIHRGSGANCE
jgi:hypothetical protein